MEHIIDRLQAEADLRGVRADAVVLGYGEFKGQRHWYSKLVILNDHGLKENERVYMLENPVRYEVNDTVKCYFSKPTIDQLQNRHQVRLLAE